MKDNQSLGNDFGDIVIIIIINLLYYLLRRIWEDVLIRTTNGLTRSCFGLLIKN